MAIPLCLLLSFSLYPIFLSGVGIGLGFLFWVGAGLGVWVWGFPLLSSALSEQDTKPAKPGSISVQLYFRSL